MAFQITILILSVILLSPIESHCSMAASINANSDLSQKDIQHNKARLFYKSYFPDYLL